MEVVDIRVVLAPAISLACAGLVFAFGASIFWRRFWSLSAAVIKFGVVLSMLPGSLRGVVYVYDLVDFTQGIGIGFRADALGMFFSLVSSTLWIFTTIYAIGYMKGEDNRVRFFGFFALCVSTTVGIAFAANMLTLFLFYEMLTICTYPLVIHDETPEAFRAGPQVPRLHAHRRRLRADRVDHHLQRGRHAVAERTGHPGRRDGHAEARCSSSRCSSRASA